jgi:carbon catabolite-derepressing protein kinase
MPAMGDKEQLMVFPASKLGEYTVIKDIAEGTFGKVKSM